MSTLSNLVINNFNFMLFVLKCKKTFFIFEKCVKNACVEQWIAPFLYQGHIGSKEIKSSESLGPLLCYGGGDRGEAGGAGLYNM